MLTEYNTPLSTIIEIRYNRLINFFHVIKKDYMSYYTKSGSTVSVSSTKDYTQPFDHLPVGTYTVQRNIFGFYLQEIDDFVATPKVYGTIDKKAQRIIDTFNVRAGSTGVMLAGEKGCGKTMLARELSLKLAKSGVATIVINQPWCGEEFNQFIQSIEDDALILFDEFEKVYGDGDQEKLLTLLDGTYVTKKLFVFTCNNIYRVNSYMTNRPGRVYYLMEFKGLDAAFVREYCADRLDDKTKIEQVAVIGSACSHFNFDMLKALVEEMNRYNEGATEALEMLNISLNAGRDDVERVVTVTTNGGKVVPLGDADGSYTVDWNPLNLKRRIRTNYPCGVDGELVHRDYYITIDPVNVKSIDANTGAMVFNVDCDGEPGIATFTRQVDRTFTFNQLGY